MEPCDSCNFRKNGCPDPLSSLCPKWQKSNKEEKVNENLSQLRGGTRGDQTGSI